MLLTIHSVNGDGAIWHFCSEAITGKRKRNLPMVRIHTVLEYRTLSAKICRGGWTYTRQKNNWRRGKKLHYYLC